MTSQAGSVRQPSDDLTAFDISKRSPDQIAQVFARRKEQRRRLLGLEAKTSSSISRSHAPRFMPVTVYASAEAEPLTAPSPAGSSTIHYSVSFTEIVANGQRDPAFLERLSHLRDEATSLQSPQRVPHRSKLRWVLAGAASILAIAGVSGTILWHSASPVPEAQQKAVTETALTAPTANHAARIRTAARVRIAPIPEQSRLLPAATLLPAVPFAKSEVVVDQALMRPAPAAAEPPYVPLIAKLKPQLPKVQTASRSAAPPELVFTSHPFELKSVSGIPVAIKSGPSASASIAVPPALAPISHSVELKPVGAVPAAIESNPPAGTRIAVPAQPKESAPGESTDSSQHGENRAGSSAAAAPGHSAPGASSDSGGPGSGGTPSGSGSSAGGDSSGGGTGGRSGGTGGSDTGGATSGGGTSGGDTGSGASGGTGGGGGGAGAGTGAGGDAGSGGTGGSDTGGGSAGGAGGDAGGTGGAAGGGAGGTGGTDAGGGADAGSGSGGTGAGS